MEVVVRVSTLVHVSGSCEAAVKELQIGYPIGRAAIGDLPQFRLVFA